MRVTSIMPVRVDFWRTEHGNGHQRIGRIDRVSDSRCAIFAHTNPDPGTLLELRIHLGDSDWPLREAHTRVLWSHTDSFAVEFDTLSAGDWTRLKSSLTCSQRTDQPGDRSTDRTSFSAHHEASVQCTALKSHSSPRKAHRI